MKVSCAQSWLLLLLLVQNGRSQVSALCSGPTVLCCAGRNDSCTQECYCDEYCVTAGDCCADYIQTCQLPPSSPSSFPTSLPSTSPPSSSSSSTSPTTNQSPTSLSSSPTSPPSTSAFSSTPQQKENIRAITVFHTRVRSTANEEAMRKSVQAFILHLSLTRRQRCEDCSARVLNISKKYHH
ncbi:uncharacterized protein LOC130087264 [Rhinichthys klamathensis goyatoka]|uniref:uncharacterized protein LOC130087264 n=1 Tax=Rhinichthys klamathensis goyatoka TaxID=3034132 RepID=UPI0024B5F10B|nr:uncharacterized protein LOC130087264 [Rhinichthys klamathensis goyatoka]